MNKVTSHKRSKRDWAALIVTACLILIVIYIALEAISNRYSDDPTLEDQQYSEKLEKISNSYRQCMEQADSELPSVGSNTYDSMQGTPYSIENRAFDAREDCTRTYDTQMRILKNR